MIIIKLSRARTKNENKTELIITIREKNQKNVWAFPVNFWATVENENNMLDVLNVALSYISNPNKYVTFIILSSYQTNIAFQFNFRPGF